MSDVVTRPRVLSPAPRGLWRMLLAADPDALPDHTPEWVDAICADGRHVDASRLYELADGRRFVLPMTRRVGSAGLGGWLASHPPSWGIGGLVGPGIDSAVVTAVLNDLARLDAARIWLRPNPVRAANWPQIGRHRLLRVPRCAHVLDLSGGPDAVLARMPASTRRGLRVAARRGVRVEVDRTGALLPVHERLYRMSVLRWAARQHEPVPLARWRAARRDPPSKLNAIARHLGSALVVLVAYVNDQPVASNITLLGVTAHDTRAAIDRPLAGPVRAAELLQWHAIQLACEHGCRTHHLGESGSSAGLARFKERFGARAVPYAEYRLERVPASRIDRAVRSAAKTALRIRD